MSTATSSLGASGSQSATAHFDVIVVGAGISGIGAAYHLQRDCPDRTWCILEGRSDLGGTWDLFRYPGIRSDSDMHTLGFGFRPWTDAKTIADGPAILDYLHDTVAEYGIADHIRFDHLVSGASWSSSESTWTITATDNGDPVSFTCNYLFMCSGYYSYRGGYQPDFVGQEDFTGRLVHPQDWPEDLDYRDKEVVIIGSGATAVTLVPAMAADAAHVTMLQRSPSYVMSRPSTSDLPAKLRRFLPDRLAHKLVRGRSIALTELLYRRTRTAPEKIRARLLDHVRNELGDDYDVDTHFTPSYQPWDQRLCLVPDSDLFRAITSGDASVVTDHIERFTPTGILLRSGEELRADIIVSATGLQLVTLGEMDFEVDGVAVDFSRTWTYKGLAYSDVPNLASTFGYINASWTLRADLNSEYVCRLLNHMRETGATTCTPRLRPEDADMPERPWIDDFSSGYMQRMMPLLPRQGDREPWLNTQLYSKDKKLLRRSPVDDGVMIFR